MNILRWTIKRELRKEIPDLNPDFIEFVGIPNESASIKYRNIDEQSARLIENVDPNSLGSLNKEAERIAKGFEAEKVFWIMLRLDYTRKENFMMLKFETKEGTTKIEKIEL